MLDKSDNESSALSLRSGNNSKSKHSGLQQKRSHYHSNLNEPIEEVEDEKDENQGKKIISESIQKRWKVTQHITNNLSGNHSRIKTLKSGLIESDPIYEEIEIEDDDYQSENNFYTNWENHKRKLLTQDEQMKLFNEDAHSSTGIF